MAVKLLGAVESNCQTSDGAVGRGGVRSCGTNGPRFESWPKRTRQGLVDGAPTTGIRTLGRIMGLRRCLCLGRGERGGFVPQGFPSVYWKKKKKKEKKKNQTDATYATQSTHPLRQTGQFRLSATATECRLHTSESSMTLLANPCTLHDNMPLEGMELFCHEFPCRCYVSMRSQVP